MVRREQSHKAYASSLREDELKFIWVLGYKFLEECEVLVDKIDVLAWDILSIYDGDLRPLRPNCCKYLVSLGVIADVPKDQYNIMKDSSTDLGIPGQPILRPRSESMPDSQSYIIKT